LPFPFDAVQVLGKALGRDPARAHRELRARSAAAAAAHRLGAARVLGLEARLRGQDQAGSAVVGDYLRQLGVPAEALVLRETARSTRDEAVQVAPLLDALGVSRLLVVTSAYHVPRARAVFTEVLGSQRVSVHGTASLLPSAAPGERRWILAGEPTARTLHGEGLLERGLLTAEAAVKLLPRDARWTLESWAATLWRG
jgi:uncharacterized SAM-binding protein YcdF (DUF218 family)